MICSANSAHDDRPRIAMKRARCRGSAAIGRHVVGGALESDPATPRLRRDTIASAVERDGVQHGTPLRDADPFHEGIAHVRSSAHATGPARMPGPERQRRQPSDIGGV